MMDVDSVDPNHLILEVKKAIIELRSLANFQQCPNPTGHAVSSKVRDRVLEIANELESATTPPAAAA